MTVLFHTIDSTDLTAGWLHIKTGALSGRSFVGHWGCRNWSGLSAGESNLFIMITDCVFHSHLGILQYIRLIFFFCLA